MSKFGGVGVALVTPFNSNGDIDYPALRSLVDHVIDGDVDYLVVQGTTGESPTVSATEKRELLTAVIEHTNQRVPVVYGLGGNNTRGVVQNIQEMDWTGVDGILSVSPYYIKPSQDGLYQHYSQIANVTDLPII